MTTRLGRRKISRERAYDLHKLRSNFEGVCLTWINRAMIRPRNGRNKVCVADEIRLEKDMWTYLRQAI
jgi:hypothetical protein